MKKEDGTQDPSPMGGEGAYRFEAKRRKGLPKDSPLQCGYIPATVPPDAECVNPCDLLTDDAAKEWLDNSWIADKIGNTPDGK